MIHKDAGWLSEECHISTKRNKGGEKTPMEFVYYLLAQNKEPWNFLPVKSQTNI